ncbi:MAG: hypothetical protein LC799_36190, partial [Actinobacteria bacterium]|nr:hypothetical protein [Actinomycetota bacterium]
DQGNHPGYTLACGLADSAEQVWPVATAFDVEWTNNASERTIKDPRVPTGSRRARSTQRLDR